MVLFLLEPLKLLSMSKINFELKKEEKVDFHASVLIDPTLESQVPGGIVFVP